MPWADRVPFPDRDEFGPGHRRRGGLAAAQSHQGVLLTVDHQERHVDAAQPFGAIRGTEDRPELPDRSLGQ